MRHATFSKQLDKCQTKIVIDDKYNRLEGSFWFNSGTTTVLFIAYSAVLCVVF